MLNSKQTLRRCLNLNLEHHHHHHHHQHHHRRHQHHYRHQQLAISHALPSIVPTIFHSFIQFAYFCSYFVISFATQSLPILPKHTRIHTYIHTYILIYIYTLVLFSLLPRPFCICAAFVWPFLSF